MTPTRRIRILLADDHTLVRRGIAQLLSLEPDMEIVGEAADGIEAISRANELKPDLILLDLDMPRCGGLDAIPKIIAAVPAAIIVVLTYSADDKDAVEALRRGAQGYLLKDLEPDILCIRIREAMRGESPISGTVARKILLDFRDPKPHPAESSRGEGGAPGHPLTQREIQILELVADGATNRDIAAKLFLSENTVKNHLKHILSKLQIQNRAQAVAWALREGLLGGIGEE
ncbi:MAG TPA: response regulator transcription factor [Symbiobacteriaceae bacterium]|jgi:DNA-binding NarL/FixJ family response regulator